MTATLISLISIVIGILGANICGIKKKKYSFGFIGNTIAGVFGSIFLIKSIGRMGFSPNFIVHSGELDYSLLTINMFVSFFGGYIAVIVIHKLKSKLNSSSLKIQN